MTLNLGELADRVRILDGAWGTELQPRGLPAGAAPELWNRENHGAVEAVARGYVEAGSEIILRNTFGPNRYVLAGHNAAKRTKELAEAGVAISRKVADRQVNVFASVGPTGKIAMMNELDRDDFVQAYAETASALVQGGADAVGANCGTGPEAFLTIARRLASATELAVWIKPNAARPEIGPNGTTNFPIGPEAFAGYARRIMESGARFIGGCCGTTADSVRAIIALLRRTLPKKGSEHVVDEEQAK